MVQCLYMYLCLYPIVGGCMEVVRCPPTAAADQEAASLPGRNRRRPDVPSTVRRRRSSRETEVSGSGLQTAGEEWSDASRAADTARLVWRGETAATAGRRDDNHTPALDK